MHIEILYTILGAILMGGAIGVERTVRGRPAGFRTHILVCLSAAVLTVVGKLVLLDFVPDGFIRADPSRMAQGIMTGIGFLGAGVIMKEGLTVRGLTTAASIWMTASIGIVIGLGFYGTAITTTLAVIIVLVVFGWVEKITPTRYFRRLSMTFDCTECITTADLERMLKAFDIKAKAINYTVYAKKQTRYDMTIFSNHRDNFELLVSVLGSKSNIMRFSVSFKD